MFWKSLLTFALDYLFKKLPGFIDEYIIKPAKEAAAKRKREKEIDKKVKAHKDAKNKKDKIDSFNDLP